MMNQNSSFGRGFRVGEAQGCPAAFTTDCADYTDFSKFFASVNSIFNSCKLVEFVSFLRFTGETPE
jgi:hypothetical protein